METTAISFSDTTTNSSDALDVAMTTTVVATPVFVSNATFDVIYNVVKHLQALFIVVANILTVVAIARFKKVRNSLSLPVNQVTKQHVCTSSSKNKNVSPCLKRFQFWSGESQLSSKACCDRHSSVENRYSTKFIQDSLCAPWCFDSLCMLKNWGARVCIELCRAQSSSFQCDFRLH